MSTTPKTKRCSTCHRRRRLDKFSRFKAGYLGLQANCRDCANTKRKEWGQANRARLREYDVAWTAAHPERKGVLRRRSHLMVTYGITLEQYDEMLAVQGGVCKGCGTPTPVGRRKHFDVDHDHETGEVRGLLCSPCNTKDVLGKP